MSYERRERPASGELRWVRITLFPDREPGRQDRRRVRRHQRHRRRHPHPRGAQVAGSAAAPVRRQHPGSDRLSRQEAQVHLRQPGVRQLGVPAAGPRSTARRPTRSCRTTSTRSCARSSSARRKARTSTTSASASAPTGSGAGCTDASRPTSMRPARCAACIAPNTTSTTSSSPSRRWPTREEQLRLFTDNIPEPVVYVDTERNYTFVNDAFLRLVGMDRDDVIGKSVAATCSAPRSSNSSSRSSIARRAARDVTYERAAEDVNGRHALAAQQDRPGHALRRHDQGLTTSSATTSPTSRQAQDALAARESQLRAIMDGVPGAGGVHRPRRALPVRQPHVPAVLRPDRRAGRRACACAMSSATASTPARRRCCHARSRANRPRSIAWSPARAARGAG